MPIKTSVSKRKFIKVIFAKVPFFLMILLDGGWVKKILASSLSTPVKSPPLAESKIAYPAEEALTILTKGNETFVKALNNPKPNKESRDIFCQHLIEDKIIHQKKDFINNQNGQKPKAIIVGCSDSRVPPEIIFDQGIGDLFVIRLAGNLIDGAGHPILGSIEYAITHLNVRLIVLLGHQKCGAINAVLEKILNPFNISGSERANKSTQDNHEPLEELISVIKKQISKSEIENALVTMAQSPSIKDNVFDKLMDLAIRKNITSGVDYLSKHEKFNHFLSLKKEEKLVIKGAIYSIETGKVDFV